jgi:dihydrofolate reductase
MGKVKAEITMSVDGYVAGPNQSRETPLGEGGEELHEWMVQTKAFAELHGRSGGEEGPDSDLVGETHAGVGAIVMGRNMFGGGKGPWGSDPAFDDPWNGWWGDDPPYHMPVFVLTHHAREPIEMQGGTTFHFVTDGVESAHERAREAAADKDILVPGGANAIQQFLAAGLVDELNVHVVPQVLGAGERLLDDLGESPPKFEIDRVIDSPAVTHIRYRVS